MTLVRANWQNVFVANPKKLQYSTLKLDLTWDEGVYWQCNRLLRYYKRERERERENKRGGESIQFILVTAKYILV
jgi:hypothetical protein